MTTASSEPTPARRRIWLRGAFLLLGIGVLTFGVWGAIWWAKYPKAPDVSQVSFDEAIQFMGTDEFGRLTKSHRKRYTLAIAERSRTIPFKQVVGMFTSDIGGRRKSAAHLADLSQDDKEEIGSAFMRSFLDGFYAQSGSDRQFYLMMFAGLERTARSRAATQPTTKPRKEMSELNVPTPEQLEKEMGKLLSRQPPKTVAQMSQLFSDMRRTRELLGMK